MKIKKNLYFLIYLSSTQLHAIDLQSLKQDQINQRNINVVNNSNNITGSISDFSSDTQSNNNNPIPALNVLRERYGFNDLRINKSLENAAKNHAFYLENKEMPSHDENPSDNRFTGSDPLQRSIKTGYINGKGQYSVGEVVAFYDGEHEDDLGKFLVAIYHRFIILDPKFQEIGYYYSKVSNKNIIEIMLGTTNLNNAIQYSNYPYDNQNEVPINFYPEQELPNPMPGYNIVGYPISFQITGGHDLLVKHFSLKDSQNNEVEGKFLTSDNDKEVQKSQFAFIPLKVLKEKETYFVSISGIINNNNFNKEWSFSTKEMPKPKLFTEKNIYVPNENFNLFYKNIESSSVGFRAGTVGSKNNLIQVVSQEWGKISLKTLPGCTIPEGCEVTMKIVADNNSYSTTIKVLPH